MIDYCEELKTIFDQFDASAIETDTDVSGGVVFYGAGELALDLSARKNLRVKYVVDRSARGTVCGVNILPPSEIPERDLENALFLICITKAAYNEIESYLKSLGCRRVLHFYTFAYLTMPDIIENGWFVRKDSEFGAIEAETICCGLAHDKVSTAHYLQFLRWRLLLQEMVYEPILPNSKYFDAPCFRPLGNSETFLDGGAHFGSVTRDFIDKTNNLYDKVYAFEPDEANCEVLREQFNDERVVVDSSALSDRAGRVRFMDGLGYASKVDANGGVTVKSVKIDELDISPTIIKLHVEGAELRALEGAAETIERHRPVLMVIAGHNADGLYKIPKFLLGLERYRVYFYLHDFCGNTAVFYAMPC